MFGEVEVGAFVEEIGAFGDDDKAMRKAGWNPQHAVIFAREGHAHRLAEGGRAAAHIDGDIEDLALRHAHQLALRTLQLIVQAAQNALGGAAVVVLHEVQV